jgi:hypothetical protein
MDPTFLDDIPLLDTDTDTDIHIDTDIDTDAGIATGIDADAGFDFDADPEAVLLTWDREEAKTAEWRSYGEKSPEAFQVDQVQARSADGAPRWSPGEDPRMEAQEGQVAQPIADDVPPHPLARRLGVEPALVHRIDLLRAARLPEPEALLEAAFSSGPSDPAAAQVLLASGLLSSAQRTPEARLAVTLSLLARLVARADPQKTLGPTGAGLRAELMPNGWRYTISSWPRLRYAWRGGLVALLDPRPEDASTVEALDEVTRLNPSEAEPVSVSIHEAFPEPRVGFGVAALSLVVSGWTLAREIRREKVGRRGRRRR